MLNKKYLGLLFIIFSSLQSCCEKDEWVKHSIHACFACSTIFHYATMHFCGYHCITINPADKRCKPGDSIYFFLCRWYQKKEESMKLAKVITVQPGPN